jgi:hypothetical protein
MKPTGTEKQGQNKCEKEGEKGRVIRNQTKKINEEIISLSPNISQALGKA